jgi:N-acetylmuramoyl-L-alanine amidase
VTQNLKDINLIVIHCSATREDKDYPFVQLKNDHRLRGFTTVGYHRYIKKDGSVFVGRPFTSMGAHVAGHNKNSIGICYEGGLSKVGVAKDTRTDLQKKNMNLILSGLLTQLVKAGCDVQKIRITGHRDLSPDKDGNGVVEPDEWIKMCPCFEAEPEFKDFIPTWLSTHSSQQK